MGFLDKLAAREGGRRAEFFRQHRFLMIGTLLVVMVLPMWVILLAQGVPMVPASIGMGVAALIGGYAGYCSLTRPEDPGWVAQAVRRLGGY